MIAASLYSVVEGEDPGFDIFVNGHALARNEDALELLDERLHVAPLFKFFFTVDNSIALLLDQRDEALDWTLPLPQPQWYEPANGLLAVRKLMDYFGLEPVALGSETQPISCRTALV
jgi:hypothetical protein